MKLFFCSIGEFGDLCGAEYLLPDRKRQMERYLHPEDRARCLVAGLMLRACLGEGYGESLVFGLNGKPQLSNSNRFFNLSHAGEYVVLAVAGCEVGVDIEQVLPYSASVAKKCFTQKEQQWLEQQQSTRAFYRLWTGKESVMKATGLGFKMPPESFHIMPVTDGAHIISGKTWFLQWHSLGEHELCAASAAAEPTQTIAVGRAELLTGAKWNI